MSEENIFKFSAELPGNKEVPLSEYEGKAILVVNTASKCGYTPQFEGLEAMYKKYKDKGFVILGFPCDQFGNQEFAEEEETQSFCKVNYGVTFPVFTKIDVNGSNAHPVFKYLKKELPGILGSQAIKWNFTKFLIDKNGNPVRRYAPQDTPASIEGDVEAALK